MLPSAQTIKPINFSGEQVFNSVLQILKEVSLDLLHLCRLSSKHKIRISHTKIICTIIQRNNSDFVIIEFMTLNSTEVS